MNVAWLGPKTKLSENLEEASIKKLRIKNSTGITIQLKKRP